MANRYPDPQPPPGYFVEILIDENNNQEAVMVPNNPLPEETSETESEGEIPDEDFVTWDMAQVTGEFYLAYEHFARRHRARETREVREAQQAREEHAASIEGSAGHDFGLTGGEHGDTDGKHGQDEHDAEAEGHLEDDGEGDASADNEDGVEVKGEPSKHST